MSETELVAQLFGELADLDRAAREAIYRDRDVSDSVRAEIESLLGEQPHRAFAEDALGAAVRTFALDSHVVSWEPGTEVGDYEIVREVARGGMGVVFEAKQRSPGRRVAIKVVPPSQFADASDLDRFRAETEAIARLEHSGIVPVYEVAEHDGMPFYSMPFLAGGSLKELELPLAPRRAADLIAQICDAVHYAHTQNIVHRDLKPANVLLTDSLQPKVSDFGLAKDVGEDSEDLTRTGAVLGTPGFMAPEQARGEGDAVGLLADVYGLGGILFYLLTARAPIEGQNLVETLHNVVHQDAPDVRRLRPGLPADLASICAKALEKAAERRYGSAAALAADLRRFLAGEPTEARPLRIGQRLLRWCRRRPAVASLAATALLSLLGGATAATLYGLEASRQAKALALSNSELQSKNQALVEARADAVAFGSFLIEDVVKSARAPSSGGLGQKAMVRDALLAALPKIEERFRGRPLAEAQARLEIGVTLREAGVQTQSIEQLEQALAIRRRLLGADAIESLSTWKELADAHYAAKQFKVAAAQYLPLIEAAEQLAPRMVPSALRKLALCYQTMGRHDEMRALMRRAADLSTGLERALILSTLCWAQAGDAEKARRTVAEVRKLVAAHATATSPEVPLIERGLLVCFQRLEDEAEVNAIGQRLIDREIGSQGATSAAAVVVARHILRFGDQRLKTSLALLALNTIIDSLGKGDLDELCRLHERAGRVGLAGGDLEAARHHASASYLGRFALDRSGPLTFRSEALMCEALVELGRTKEAAEHLRPRIDLLRRLAKASEKAAEKAAKRERKQRRYRLYRDALTKFEELLPRL